MSNINMSFDEKWEAIIACDTKYDGLFYTAVKTTKIFCRPSCRSRKPKKKNVEFYDVIKEVEAAGYRACKRCQPEVQYSPHELLIREVTAYLVKNYGQKIELIDISSHAGVSPYYLTRLFKKETGVTPRAYLEQIRIDKATHLLRTTDKKNIEICYAVGFQSPSSFYKVFKQHKKCSPSDYKTAIMEMNEGLT